MVMMLIGPDQTTGVEAWDLAFVAYYPTAGAFLEMVTDPAYRIAVKHRQAAVADSRLLRCGEEQASDQPGLTPMGRSVLSPEAIPCDHQIDPDGIGKDRLSPDDEGIRWGVDIIPFQVP